MIYCPHPMILAFNKPYGVLSQFTKEAPHHRTLAEFGFPPHVYPVGRLDSDSEGLLLLSDEKQIVDRLLNPRNQHPRTYWSQVEGIPSPRNILLLEQGSICIQGYHTLPCQVRQITADDLVPPREPPIRYRASIPASWLELTLVEGKNRQVRRMTAAVGLPTLRLIRVKIGDLPLDSLPVGVWKELTPGERRRLMP